MGGLADIRFITDSPFNDAYAERSNQLTQQRGAEVQAERAQADLDQQQRQRRIDNGIDAALSDVVRARTSPQAPAPTSPGTAISPLAPTAAPMPQQNAAQPAVAPPPVPAAQQQAPQQARQQTMAGDAAARLAQVRGGGKQAFALMQAQQQQQDQWEDLAIKAMGTGDMEAFQYYQKKSGLQLPPDVMKSAEARGNFSRAMDIAKQNYREDPQQAQVFAATFMATPGDFQSKLMAASEKAGPPSSKPHWTATTVYQNGQGVLAFYDANSREQPKVQTTGLVNHQEPSSWTPTYTAGEDGSPVVSAFNSRTGEVKQGTVGAAAKPTGSASKNMLVKIGQTSGTMYPNDYSGPGLNGEMVIAMPAEQAVKVAVATGNNATRLAVTELAGDMRIANTRENNAGRADVANITGGYRVATTEQQGANSLATQKLRNEGNIAVADKRAQAGTTSGKMSVYAQKQKAWLDTHPGDAQGALDYAGGRRKMSPAEEQKAAASIAKAEFAGAFNVKPDQVQARIREIMDAWQKPAVAPGAVAPQPAPTPSVVPAPTSGQNGPAPSAKPQVPASLKGRKLQWSPSAQAFRDAATGEVFDMTGNPMGK